MKLSISFKIHLDKKKLNYFKHIYEISFRINSFNSRCICKMKTIFTSDNPFEFLSFPEIGRINTFSSDKVSWFIGISLLHKWMKVLDQDINFKVFKNQKLQIKVNFEVVLYLIMSTCRWTIKPALTHKITSKFRNLQLY